MDNINTSMPSFNIPSNAKNKEWHKSVIRAIAGRAFGGNFNSSQLFMTECYDYYNGTQSGDEYKFLQEAEDGSVLPAEWINYNKIKGKVDVLLGELYRKGWDIDVKAINKDAVVRKLDKKLETLSYMQMKPSVDAMSDALGFQSPIPENLPETEEELNKTFKKYKTTSERVVKSALKYIMTLNDYPYLRQTLMRDLLIVGRCFAKAEVKNGIPVLRRIDPRDFIFDTNAQNDYLSDSTYFGEVRYMPIADVSSYYNVSESDVMEIYEKYRNNVNSTAFSWVTKSGLDPFKTENGDLRVLVISVSFCDTKKITYKESEDNYGNFHIKNVKEDAKGDGVKSNVIKIWREGTLIGCDMLVEWGEIKNQSREIDRLYDCRSPYKCLAHNYINGRSISKVEQLRSLQKLKNITMYNIQLAMARAGAKGFVYDISQCPDDWTPADVMKYLKTVGIAFIDSKKDGIQSTFNQFQTIDMTLSTSVSQYLAISQMIDAEMDNISGVNNERQGNISAYQAVGVTNSALLQSSLTTETLFTSLETMLTHSLTHIANLAKICIVNQKERFAFIIGEDGVDFSVLDEDLDLDEYGVMITATPKILNDINMFYSMVQAALQAGQIDFLAAMKLLKEDDISAGIEMFERYSNERKEEMNQQRMQEMQQQQQMMQQQQQAQQQEMQYKSSIDRDKLMANIENNRMNHDLKSQDLNVKRSKIVSDRVNTNNNNEAAIKRDLLKSSLQNVVNRGKKDLN